jgi:hypothetical protein
VRHRFFDFKKFNNFIEEDEEAIASQGGSEIVGQ